MSRQSAFPAPQRCRGADDGERVRSAQSATAQQEEET